MKNYIYKSVMRTSLGFMTIIIYCMISMIIKFSYLDLCYMLVVIGFFITYIKYVRELYLCGIILL